MHAQQVFNLGPEDNRSMSRAFNLTEVALLIFEECGSWDLLCLHDAHPLFRGYVRNAPTLKGQLFFFDA